MMVYSKIQLHQTNVTTYKFLNSISPMTMKATKCLKLHEIYALKPRKEGNQIYVQNNLLVFKFILRIIKGEKLCHSTKMMKSKCVTYFTVLSKRLVRWWHFSTLMAFFMFRQPITKTHEKKFK